jgi:hypothetical protein
VSRTSRFGVERFFPYVPRRRRIFLNLLALFLSFLSVVSFFTRVVGIFEQSGYDGSFVIGAVVQES